MAADLSDAFPQEEWKHIVSHADATMVPEIVAVSVVGGFFSLLFVAMRLWSRRLVFKYFKLDWSDWLCLVALLFTMALVISVLVGIKFGAGRHIFHVPDLRSLYIIFLLANAFHPVAMCALKLSILVLYYSIFASRPFQWVCWGVGIFTLLWTALAIVAGVALCIPIEKLWDSTITGGVCIPLAPIGLTVTSSHIATDFILLFMPVPLVLKLHTTRKKKVLIISTFVVGGGACIVSIARLPIWMNNKNTPDIGWEQIPSAMLAIGELTVGILAACFPVYRPLLRWARGKDKMTSSSSGYPASNQKSDPEASFSMGHGSVAAKVSTNGSLARLGKGIKVTDEIELVRHQGQGGGWSHVSDEDTERLFRPSAPRTAR